jgi:hypothetical protein
MGGSGSGNFHHWHRPTKKRTVEGCLQLDINRWTREGSLKAGIRGYGSWTWTHGDGSTSSIRYTVDTLDPSRRVVYLSYSVGRAGSTEQEALNYPVGLTTTVPRFGGLRWWFICPLVVNDRPCLRRVGKLYLPGNERYFGCRHCHDLTYTSCQESHKFDSLYRFMAGNMGWDFVTVKQTMQRMERR